MGRHYGGDPPGLHRSIQDVVFLGLRDTVFCTECELLSSNHSSRCLACGSVAVLSLSRLLGGSLRNQETARLLKKKEIHSIVGEVVRCSDSVLEQRSGAAPMLEKPRCA